MAQHQGTGLNWIIGAGIVGADIGTSVFYGTGILFPVVGYLAPVFVLTACLLMWVFKRTYEEGLALSPYNGGAYSMILRSVGRRAAVVAGALTFVSYLATAAVSALSGGYYLTSLSGGGVPSTIVVLFAFVPLILFGLLNTRGIKEPAKIVTGIAGFHFGLLILMVIWGVGYIVFNWNEIDFAKLKNITPSGELTLPMLAYGFAAAFLGITGFEAAAQIVEELETPMLKTVNKLYRLVVVLVSITAPMISFLCILLMTPAEVNLNLDYLLSGLANKLGGRVLMIIVVIDATLTLFAATNTAYVGFIGLATTMAKQGNLPQVLLTRVAHKYPTIQGYPMIALPFMVISMIMSAVVAGELEIAAKVYEIAFLSVMVSFAVGVMLMRNRDMRRDTPNEYLSKVLVQFHNHTIPVPPLTTAVVLGLAVAILFVNAKAQVLLMLLVLVAGSLLVMAYYRWGLLEKRLETRSDLRLGLGKFSDPAVELPEDLPVFVLCAGGTGARRLINSALSYLLKTQKGPFELMVFHAEEGKDPEGFFYELLQRVVSQQIAPVYSQNDFILTVKILPGSLAEGLQTLKKTLNFQTLLFGSGRDPHLAQRLAEEITHELEVNVAFIQ